MLFAQAEPFMIGFAIAFILAALAFTAVLMSNFAPWLQAHMSGVPVGFLEIIGMRLRKTDVKAVLRAAIMARQAGIEVPCTEIEKAYLQGVDLEKVTLALIEAKGRDLEITFPELVEAERRDRLGEKLGGTA